VASDKPDAMGFYSRYCAERLLSPSAADDPAAFGRWLLRTLQAKRYDVLLFFGEASAAVIMQHREEVQARTGCPLPSYDAFLTADRKDRVLRLARSAGVRAPRTVELTDLDGAEAGAASLQYPVVVKGVWGSCGRQVAVARDAGALRPTVERIAALRQSPDLPLPILQEYIPGTGYGVSALCREGEPRAVFQHRRLEEHDIRRGLELAHAAAGAESVNEPEMRHAAEALLRALQWDGMAMVEFRRSDIDGHFYVMEINPRFVGTLDLAVASGVDFPWLYAQQALGRPVAAAPAQRNGVQYHWLVSKSAARAFEDPAGTMRAALAALRPGVRSDLCWRDPGPHYAHLRTAAWWIREYRRPSAAPASHPAADATSVAGPATASAPAVSEIIASPPSPRRKPKATAQLPE
jgi:predicted ATP-grasp superfamily ATP-dependent carboligase